jgi:erythromycin esterase
MKKVLAGLLVLTMSSASSAQPVTQLESDPRVRWLQKNAITIRTVDPAADDFRDLEPLKMTIGNARIVMLGEISHGDGTTLLAKSRLVKFLHQQMQFDVVVFESNFFDTARSWEAIRNGQDPVAALPRAMPPVWVLSPQVKGLWDYIRANATSSRPLALAGFTPYSSARVLGALDTVVVELGITSELTTAGSATRTLAADLLGNKYGPQGLPAPDSATRISFYAALDALRDRFTRATTPNNTAITSQWRQVVLSLRSLAEMRWGMRANDYKDPDWSFFNIVDAQGADNLLWLADNLYHGKKIIVWGATAHLMRQASAIDPNINPAKPQQPYTSMRPMGEQLWRRIGAQSFIIGFTSYEGSNGFGDPADKERHWNSSVQKDQDASVELEELFNAARFDYALVNFRTPATGGEWLRTPIVSRPLANTGMRASWPQVLDAMFFIRLMEPNRGAIPR